MAETKKCSFTGKPIPPGTGMMYVKKTGQVLYFINSKAKKNYLNLNRVPSRTKWTDTARKLREKGLTKEHTSCSNQMRFAGIL